MKDDAVAPVVAAMLVLAIVVTFFSVWNAVYLPSIKQQSEMEQAHAIETAFSRFSSDIATAASLKRDGVFTEPLPLGGGGVIFSPSQSSGTIRVDDEPRQLYEITIVDSGGSHVTNGRLVNFSYRPVNDFWIDQGYVWHYGYVNVTRGSSLQGADSAALSTPLGFPSMREVRTSGTIRSFAGSLITIEAQPWYNSTSNCSKITISSIAFRREPGRGYASGNGIGTLALAAYTNETEYGAGNGKSPERVVVRVSRSVPEPFSTGLFEACNRSFAHLNATYPGSIAHIVTTTAQYNETSIAPIAGSLPFSVTHHHVAVNVSAT